MTPDVAVHLAKPLPLPQAKQLAASQRLRCLRHTTHSWLQYVAHRRHKQQRLLTAFRHRHLHLVQLAFWSWHQAAQSSAQQLQQAHGLAVHQRAMQVSV